jgi:hypothetical protein
MIEERRVKSFMSNNGLHRAFIIARADGFYQFREESHEPASYSGWAPAGTSGVYASLADAERATHHDLPWLKDQISN